MHVCIATLQAGLPYQWCMPVPTVIRKHAHDLVSIFIIAIQILLATLSLPFFMS